MDEARIACAIKDLQAVAFSTELSDNLKVQKGKIAVIIRQLDDATKDPDCSLTLKTEATNAAEAQMKPILAELKEAVRRIRVPWQQSDLGGACTVSVSL